MKSKYKNCASITNRHTLTIVILSIMMISATFVAVASSESDNVISTTSTNDIIGDDMYNANMAIIITLPNGGETWQRGTSHIITWSSIGNIGTSVKIELLKNNIPVGTVVSNTPNDGSHPWTISPTRATGVDYKIKVTSTSDPTYFDTSNGNFAISSTDSIVVTSPNGGETLVRGIPKTITWSSAGNPGPNVKIELLKNNIPVGTVTSGTPNDGSYSWTVSSTRALGSDYKIRITSTSNPAITDTSNNNFTIGGINVNVPNGGETWARGTTHTITWSKLGSPGANVKIELLKNGISVGTVASSTPNDGSQGWTVSPGRTPGTDYKIRVTSTTNALYKDTSDKNFTISAPITTTPSLGVFYYPWTGGKSENWRHWIDHAHNPPKTWFSNYLPDYITQFDPNTELYSSKNTTIIKWQLGLMRKAGIGFSISSWWGQNSFEDQALDIIFNQVLPAADNPYPDIKFAIYYEKEGFADVSKSEIISDINYIKNKYGNSPYYYKVDGKPVIFVYNADDGGVNDAQKWKQVRDETGIYTVLKVFSGYQSYANLADSWHQYAPTTSYEAQGAYSAFVSPGYHKGDEAVRLGREDFTRFENDVVKLKNANVKFKLIETWNEWGEGTGVEPAQKINHDDVNGFTAAASSYGTKYVDILGKYFSS